MTGAFYQHAWEIIGENIYNMVRDFMEREELQPYITHTNLVLLQKKVHVNYTLSINHEPTNKCINACPQDYCSMLLE